MNKQQEPCLRFNGFSGAWEEKYLDEVGEFSAGGDIKKEKLTPFGRYPVLANALTNNGIVGFYNDYEFESPAITITGRGDVGIAKARKENFSAVVRLLVLKNKPNYDVDFLEKAINKIDFHIESTGVPQLTAPQCRLYSIYLPSEPEQTHLGLFFRRLDSQIAESSAVLEKSRQLKKAMLAKMFPANGEKIPKIRFKGFEGEWESRKLGEIGSTFGGLTNKSREDFGHGDARYITYMNVYQNALSSEHQLDSIEIDVKQNEVKKGDVLFTTSSETPEEVGMSSVWAFDINNVYLNSFCFGYRLNKQINLNYLAYCLRSDYIRSQMILLAQGISRYNISKKGVMEIEILIPTAEEQTAIGNFFRQLDETIALQSAEVEKLNQLKKGLLAAMLV